MIQRFHPPSFLHAQILTAEQKCAKLKIPEPTLADSGISHNDVRLARDHIVICQLC